jgi:hypothetical protein
MAMTGHHIRVALSAPRAAKLPATQPSFSSPLAIAFVVRHFW